MSGKKYTRNRDFQELAAKINRAIQENDGHTNTPEERTEQQKAQVEKLYKLEKRFKNNLLYYQQTTEVYKKFVNFIKNEDVKGCGIKRSGKVVDEGNGNILTAQPYFRESGKIFSKNISSAIKDENIEELFKYDINALLAMFIVENWEGEFPKRIQKTFDALLDTRRVLIENNLPLAINHAKLFYRKTPKSTLTLLELIDIATDGLATGVDKFVGEYSKVWRSVCLGRMTGFMIDEYSKTFIRMYPSDRKILYRANSLKHKLKLDTTEELAKAVNESFEEDKKKGKSVPKKKVTSYQLVTLMNSSHYWSADTKPSKDGKEEEHMDTIYDYHPDDAPNPEEELIKKELIGKMMQAISVLSTMEKKIIQLKGVDI